jgi:hypothetical protein
MKEAVSAFYAVVILVLGLFIVREVFQGPSPDWGKTTPFVTSADTETEPGSGSGREWERADMETMSCQCRRNPESEGTIEKHSAKTAEPPVDRPGPRPVPVHQAK